MSIWTNFKPIIDELISTERIAEFAPLVEEKLFAKLNILDHAILVEGIRQGDPSVTLVKSAIYNAIEFNDGDTCETTTCEVSVDYKAKKWLLAFADCRVVLCPKNAQREFMALYGRYKSVNPESDEYSFIIEQMSDILADTLANSLVAKAFLADKAYTEKTLNGLDGFIAQWKLEEDNILDVAGLVADVNAPTGKELYDVLAAMYDKYDTMDIRHSIEESRFTMDEKDARTLVRWLNQLDRQHAYDCECLDAAGLVRSGRYSVDGLHILGLPVVTIPYKEMSKQFDELVDAGKLVNPIFAVLTPKEEVQIGTPAMSELGMNEAFYDKKDKQYYFDIGYQFGAMIPSNNFVLADVLTP